MLLWAAWAGGGEGKGGRGWFSFHFEHTGTGEDDPNIWIRFFLHLGDESQGKRLCQEVTARKEEELGPQTNINSFSQREPGCWSLRIRESNSFKTVLALKILSVHLGSYPGCSLFPCLGFPRVCLSLSLGPPCSKVASLGSPLSPCCLQQRPRLLWALSLPCSLPRTATAREACCPLVFSRTCGSHPPCALDAHRSCLESPSPAGRLNRGLWGGAEDQGFFQFPK